MAGNDDWAIFVAQLSTGELKGLIDSDDTAAQPEVSSPEPINKDLSKPQVDREKVALTAATKSEPGKKKSREKKKKPSSSPQKHHHDDNGNTHTHTPLAASCPRGLRRNVKIT